MAAAAPTIPRVIRVYCPTHKVGFTADANRVIECSSQKHALANSLAGENFWEYCCDCQHYWPLDGTKASIGSGECPACERQMIRRFLCATCQVVSGESDSPGRRKEFSISKPGVPTPTCPGCLLRPGSVGLGHECKDFGCAFFTTRSVCPFCDEILERPANFPCSVSTYRQSLRVPTVLLRFGADSTLLEESTSGDYVLVEKAPGSPKPLVVPKAQRFNSKQDYYNVYYELFNCENPSAGEVIILLPAIVEPAENGWQLKETGSLEVKPDLVPIASSQPSLACSFCGAIAVPGGAFCKQCGQALAPAANASRERKISRTPIPSQLTPELVPLPEPASPIPMGERSPAQGVIRSNHVLKVVLAVSTGVILLSIIAALVKTTVSGSGVEKKLDTAITTGNVFGPSPENAHDLYYQLKSEGANEQLLGRYRERLLPVLTNHPQQLISELMVPGNEDPSLSDWQTATQSLKWAVELKGSDSSLLARALYCEGRAAFLMKQEDQAIEIWGRAAEADKSWPLPLNGIGLIYSGRKNYSIAKGYFFDAVRKDPTWAYPYNNLGTAFHLEKNDYVAKDYYKKAVERAPHWARPHAWLGDIALLERDFITAIAEYQAVLDPGATGTKNMDLDKIRQRLDKARQQVSTGEE
ncbi:MAG TPA: tetratricopeptide repeat protein [Pyrinomonadaceae bacterium]|nr:tetratricopeptide repeat protein [Pyrinomonadaceae bacterium]